MGSSAEHDSKILALRPFDQARTEDNSEHGSFRKVANSVYFQQFSDSASMEHDRDVEVLDAIEEIVSPHGGSLIKLYFRIVHPSFPILHKKVKWYQPGIAKRLTILAGLPREVCTFSPRIHPTSVGSSLPPCAQLVGVQLGIGRREQAGYGRT